MGSMSLRAVGRVSLLTLPLLLASCGDDHDGSGHAGNAGTTAGAGGSSSGDGGRAGSASAATGGSAAVGGTAGSGGTGNLAGKAGFGGAGSGGAAMGGTSGDAAAAGTAGSTVTGDHPARTLYAAICDLHRACCETAGFQQNVFTTCDVSAGADVYSTSIAAGRLTIDEAALASCAEHLRATYVGCDSVLTFDDTFAGFADCVGGIAGAVALGDACGFDEECAGAGDGRVRCLNDVCSDVPIGQAGDPCIQTKGPRSTRPAPPDATTGGGAECRRQDGLYCHEESATAYACAPVLADGAPCEAEEQCSATSYCTGTCDPVRAPGGSCTSNSECGALYCNKDSLTCASIPDRASCEK
jgi:hypothetical protein